LTGALRIPTVVVIGGGAVGATTVRQLLRARRASRLWTEAIVVVDRDPLCAVARARPEAPVRVETADWSAWLDAGLERLGPEDHLVPYHWAPHLLLTWLRREAARAGAVVEDGPSLPSRGLPYDAPTAGGDRALSYASWPCPPLCIEPRLCPHTRGPRDWSLAEDLLRVPPGAPFSEAVVFRCLHLVYGVGTVPVSAILEARDRVLAGLEHGPRAWLIATSSHCHALARVMHVEPGQRAVADDRIGLGGMRAESPNSAFPSPHAGTDRGRTSGSRNGSRRTRLLTDPDTLAGSR
jgi:hypothetical protein